MPAVTSVHPKKLIGKHQKEVYMDVLSASVARYMFCEEDVKPDREAFDPNLHIDVVLQPHKQSNARKTAVIMLTVVTYAKETRMVNIDTRLQAIAEEVAKLVPDDYRQKIHNTNTLQDRVSVTFISKGERCWVAVA